ncbi:23S rRNA (uracil(1939)-C(5))-methyltransferase RlmD [Pseudoalteromonas sp. MMG005]|uniref:23S rRNA (uracil(1939)-C(5))-methyltransferase RlmD n=1 Tax=Pseudoalteromonas sp. MMG005 TaxID=2822682 RepID=UPI001B3A46B7|nr:23S rRNA (uracil(1939)-C(5))-methyltransferase RlmD [Pseudoalteromonas sp. MMG005]MBQ4846273.1 23S rRNA (uracil(1939)-C(5))-methyltransferase RlmD [Pseudoalteromonas sp. MMG005]
MAQIFRPKKRTVDKQAIEVKIHSLDHQGRGVANHKGKVCFVEGALVNERVKAQVLQDKSKLIEAKTLQVIEPSNERVTPFCRDNDTCGGCQTQHLVLSSQLFHKQQAVDKLFQKFAQYDVECWQPAIESKSKYYRRSARIACFYDKGNKLLKLGFRGFKSKKIVEVKNCQVLTGHFDNIFEDLRALLNSRDGYCSVSHVQLCDADNGQFVLLRHTKSITARDKDYLEEKSHVLGWKIVWDNGDKVSELNELPYYIADDVRFNFTLDNFVQVNAEVNTAMLMQALMWLEVSYSDRVLDLFCGIGNFSLLLAKRANSVIGVEGSASSVAMAKQNAQTNHIENAEFHCFDLTQDMAQAPWFDQSAKVLVLDPSRTGAFGILQQMPLTQFNKVLYVSCDPVTLARDSKLLLDSGLSLVKVGLMNMFPHTGHIETMALFQRR